MIDLVARVLGRVCEPSAVLAKTLRCARFKGRCRIVHAMRTVPLPGGPSVECGGGLRFDLDLRDDVQRAIYFDCYEPRDLTLISPLASPGGTCLDVGANVGFYALHFAKQVGPTGRVFAFEPDPRNAARLRRNIELNRFESIVRVAEAAVSDHQGKAVLHRSDDAHSGWGSLSERPGEIASIEVPLTTLDSFLETQRIEQVDLLKVDVEGSEIELLRGARRSLERHVFRHLFIEFNGVLLAERGLGPAEFLAPLEAAGYKLWPAHVGLVERMRSGADPAHTVWANLLFSAP